MLILFWQLLIPNQPTSAILLNNSQILKVFTSLIYQLESKGTHLVGLFVRKID